MSAGVELVRQLENNPDPQFRKRLMEELAKNPKILADILLMVGGDYQPIYQTENGRYQFSEKDRHVVINALLLANEKGVITKDTWRQIIKEQFFLLEQRRWPSTPEYIGLLIARSGDELRRDYAIAVLEFVRDAKNIRQDYKSMLLSSAARAMAGSSQVLSEMVALLWNEDFQTSHFEPITLKDLIQASAKGGLLIPTEKLPPDLRSPALQPTPLLDMLATAKQCDLHTQGQLFMAAGNIALWSLNSKLGEKTIASWTIAALTDLYLSNSAALTTYFMGSPAERIGPDGMILRGPNGETGDGSVGRYLDRLNAFSRFLQYTLFSPSMSDSQKEMLQGKIAEAAGRYQTAGYAQYLGRLTGTFVCAYVLRVKEQQDQYEAYKRMVQVLSSVAKAIPRHGSEISRGLNLLAEPIAKALVEKGGWFGAWGPAKPKDAAQFLQNIQVLFNFQGMPDTDGRSNSSNESQNQFIAGVNEVYLALSLSEYSWPIPTN